MIKVLHLDDNPYELELTRIKLKQINSDLHLSSILSPKEAIERLQNEKYDCILSDFQMPGMDGLEFLGAVRSFDEGVPFIFFTGQGNEEVAASALRLGANDYHTKEIGIANYERLYNSISRAVDYFRQKKTRLETENTLIETEKKYRQLVEQADNPIIILQNNLIKFINAKVPSFFGISIDKLLEKDFFQFLDQSYRQSFRDYIDSIPNEEFIGKLFKIEMNTTGKTKINVDVICSEVYFNGNSATLIEFKHVNGDKTVKEDSSQINKTPREVLNAVPAVLGTIKNDKITWIADNIYQLTGYKPVDLIGKDIKTLSYNGSPLATLSSNYGNALPPFSGRSVKTTWLQKSGKQISLHLTANVIDNSQDSPEFIFAAIPASPEANENEDGDKLRVKQPVANHK